MVKPLRLKTKNSPKNKGAFIKEKSALAHLDEPIAVESAKVLVRLKKEIDGWGLADSVVYTTAIVKKADVVTGDEHFRKLNNVIFIK